jgi:hypothetical protein
MYNINDTTNLLIFPAGSGVSKEIFDALKYIRNINIIGIDSDEFNFSSYQFDKLELGAPFIKNKEETLTYLKKVIEKYNINCIYPAFDSIIVFLKDNEEILGVKIIASPLDTCHICFSKKKTYDYFRNTILVPQIIDITNPVIKFPLFLKPECGYGARDSFKISNQHELDFYNKTVKDNIICEYLPGEEFTVDCFTSIKNGLIYCEARRRVKTVNGLSIMTQHIDLPEVKEIGLKINDKLRFVGAWFFQLKYNNKNQLCLLEIAPRIPGAASLHRNQGINFPLLSIHEHLGYAIDKININKYDISCYKCVENRFKISIDYSTVYVDLDDTIIIKGKVNTKIVQYFYHLKNMKKKIILITRNVDPIKYLESYLINTKLFDDIIIVDKEIAKSTFITVKDAIFIDDSFKERDDVFNQKNINVFSCDMIECLFDERL